MRADPPPGSVDLVYQVPGEFAHWMKVVDVEETGEPIIVGYTEFGQGVWARLRESGDLGEAVIFDAHFSSILGLQYHGDGYFLSFLRQEATNDHLVVRHGPDGQLDSTFQGPSTSRLSDWHQLIVLDDGGFWLGTTGYLSDSTPNSFIRRYASGGQLVDDLNLGSETALRWWRVLADGSHIYRGTFLEQSSLNGFPGAWHETDSIYAFFEDHSGRLVSPNGIRILPSGAVDESFVPHPQSGGGCLEILGEFPNHKLLVCDGDRIERWHEDGQLDATFQTPAQILGEEFSIRSARVLADGNVLAWGKLGGNPAVVRLSGGEAEPGPPVVIRSPATTNSKERSSVKLNVAIAGVPQPSFQWYRDGVAIPGATEQAYMIPRLGLSDAGSYSVTAQNVHGAASASTQLDITPLVPGDVDPPFSTISTLSGICEFYGALVLDGDRILTWGTQPTLDPIDPTEPLLAILDEDGTLIRKLATDPVSGYITDVETNGAGQIFVQSYDPDFHSWGVYRIGQDGSDPTSFPGVYWRSYASLEDGGVISNHIGSSRYRPDGSLDTTFSSPSWIYAYHQQLPNGNFLVEVYGDEAIDGGGIYEMDPARFPSPASLVPRSYRGPYDDRFRSDYYAALATDSTGRNIGLDTVTDRYGRAVFPLVRFLSDGSRDYSFRALSGGFSGGADQLEERPMRVDFLSNGDLIVAGGSSRQLRRIHGGDVAESAPEIQGLPQSTVHIRAPRYPNERRIHLEMTSVIAPNPTLQWYRDGEPIIGATTSILHILADFSSGGTYTLEATNAFGSATESVYINVSKFNSFEFDGGIATYRCLTTRGRSYQLQSSTALQVWQNIGEPLEGNDRAQEFELSTNSAPRTSLRVIMTSE